MAIRLYLLRVFEQFSRTEDPLASNPYRESRLRGEEREREGERKSRRSGGRRRRGRRRPVTSLERLDGVSVNEKDLIAVRALTVRNTLVTFLLLY